MTKEVLVKVEGLQTDSKEEAVVVSALGAYHRRNGKYYIRYDEVTEDGQGLIHNMLKIASGQIVITKKGSFQSQMTFDIMEGTQTNYQTPYGVIALNIDTKLIEIEEFDDEIKVKLKYDLSSEGKPISNNMINITVKAQRDN